MLLVVRYKKKPVDSLKWANNELIYVLCYVYVDKIDKINKYADFITFNGA